MTYVHETLEMLGARGKETDALGQCLRAGVFDTDVHIGFI